MTGFLQRLAKRAMGVSSPARAASAAPFAPIPATVGEEMAVEMPSNPERALDTAPAAERRDPLMAPARRVEASPSAVETAPGASAGPTLRMPLVAELATLNQISAAQPIGPGLSATQSAPSTEPRVPSAWEPAPEVRAARPESLALLASEDGLSRTSDRPADHTHPAAAAPQRLFVPTLDAPLAFRSGDLGVAAVADRRAQTVEETTEVHVHIGRIEVTAVHEPPPAKPAASRRRAPMSLDEYLAKRQGRPS
jgi:hypothetical protein